MTFDLCPSILFNFLESGNVDFLILNSMLERNIPTVASQETAPRDKHHFQTSSTSGAGLFLPTGFDHTLSLGASIG